MDLRHARTFVTVAELGTVSKAALRLRIAQPALSRQIIDLENELGLRLFDRVGRRLLLTGEGEQLLAGCRVLLNCASAVKEQAAAASSWRYRSPKDRGLAAAHRKRVVTISAPLRGALSEGSGKDQRGNGQRDIDATRTRRNPPRPEFTARRQAGRTPFRQPSARIGGAAGSLPSLDAARSPSHHRGCPSCRLSVAADGRWIRISPCLSMRPAGWQD